MLFAVAFLALVLISGCGNKGDDAVRGKDVDIQVQIKPDPPVKGENTLYLTVTDKNGKGIEKAEIKVYPSMPAHGHGSSKDPVVTEKGGGKYEVKVFFQMPGEWEVKIEAISGNLKGETVVKYTVKG